MAGADPHFEGFARLNSSDPTLGQHAAMQERIARPIGEFNEAKPLFGAEPFDDPANRWPGRGLVEPGSGAECTRLGVEAVSVELATPRATEILMSHWIPGLDEGYRLARHLMMGYAWVLRPYGGKLLEKRGHCPKSEIKCSCVTLYQEDVR